MTDSHDTLPHDQRVALLRLTDACANRCSEGLRTAEDIVRFVLDDRHLTSRLKSLRHRVAAAIPSINDSSMTSAPSGNITQQLNRARDTLADVGATVRTSQEYQRTNVADLIAANFSRAQQALRSLEEVAKTIASDTARENSAADELESCRYEAYVLQKAVLNTYDRQRLLENSRFYCLIDGQDDADSFHELAARIVTADADVIQLRDKSLDDRTLLARARTLRQITNGTSTIMIVNDRADIAAASNADGVHVGQEELSVSDVRRLVGTEALVGVSTHNIAQARAAVLAGADYLGVGPTFPSKTKSFDDFPGLAFVKAVASEISLPAFAIGGIDLGNVSSVIKTGLNRVAVSAAVSKSEDPGVTVAEFKRLLSSSPPPPKTPSLREGRTA